MSADRRTVLIKGEGWRYEEKTASGILQPGMLLGPQNSDGTLPCHTITGGKGSRMYASEEPNSLTGLTFTDPIASGQPVGVLICVPGNVINHLLKAGETAVKGSPLISAGDGSVKVLANSVISQIVADSATLTSWTTAVAFSNGTATIPANTLKVGDRIRIRARVAIPSTNSTDTMTFTVNLNAVALITTTALDVANDDEFIADETVTIRTIGASGTFVGSGLFTVGVLNSATVKSQVTNSSAIDTTAAATVTIKAACSVSNAGNQAILREFTVEILRSGETSVLAGSGNEIVAYAEEAVDNSLGVVTAWCEAVVAP